MAKKIRVKRVKARVQILKVMAYKGYNVYIRQFDKDIFTYDLSYEGEIFGDYIVVKPSKGKTALTSDEIAETVALLWRGAETTIDVQLGTKLDPETERRAKAFIEIQEKSKVKKDVSKLN